jgi:hypothetical protein
MGSLNGDIIVNTFPSIFDRPIQREDDRAARLEARRIEISEVDAKSAIFRRRILDGSPAVYAPVDRCHREELDPENTCRASFFAPAAKSPPAVSTRSRGQAR